MPVAIHDRKETPYERRARQKAEARAEKKFQAAANAHATYGAKLRQLAKQVAHIIEAVADQEKPPYSSATIARIRDALRDYSKAIAPWARRATAQMMAEVDRRSRTALMAHAAEMGSELRLEILGAPVGEVMRQLMAEQVDLITSLPLEAAQRVHEKTLAAVSMGGRYVEQTAEIEQALAEAHPDATAKWVRNRATLIARTETARTASKLVESRAKHIGAEQYEWMTSGDWKVRESHRKLDRTVHSWDNPPLSDPPDHRSHPGQIWNCRCVALPIIPA
jgi:SPP1 gp7 family putative phage head morphogenesis protein